MTESVAFVIVHEKERETFLKKKETLVVPVINKHARLYCLWLLSSSISCSLIICIGSQAEGFPHAITIAHVTCWPNTDANEGEGSRLAGPVFEYQQKVRNNKSSDNDAR